METSSFNSLFRPFRRLSSVKPNANRLLFIATILALILANSPWAHYYFDILAYPISFTIGSVNFFSHHGVHMTLIEFVNDALMALFFFIIGLEIKQEVLIGELSSVRKAMLPIFAALGGMIVPVMIYLLVCNSSPEIRGAAIPMSTDIAFALAVLASLGKRVPTSLKVFLTALAVVDDLGGIMVIALFYSQGIAWEPLLISFGLLAILYIGGRLGMKRKLFYYILGFIVWMLFLESGIHPTIAGVLVAFTIPALPDLDLKDFSKEMKSYMAMLDYNDVKHGDGVTILTSNQIRILNQVHRVTDSSISPLQRIADSLHPYIYMVILPLFAFVNAGVAFGTIDPASLLGIPLAIMFGLFIGKSVGIYSFTYFFFKYKFVQVPPGVNKRNLFGVSMLGGIGFTVALFISNLAFATIPDVGADLLSQAKIGVFAGSILSGVVGYYILKTSTPEQS